MRTKLEGRLVTKRSYWSHDPILAQFSLTNKGDRGVMISRRGTPLEGLISDCLEITRDGEPIPYDGPLVRRAPPTADSYVRLDPGETIDVELDLMSAYQVSAPGRYEVRAVGSVLDVVDLEGLKWTGPVDERTGASFNMRKRTFHVRTGRHFQATQGEAVRRTEADAPQATSESTEAGPAGIHCVGGSDDQRRKAFSAYSSAYKLIKTSTYTSDRPRFKTWFGSWAQSRAMVVRGMFYQMLEGMEANVFTYDLSITSGCEEEVLAYTYFNSKTIFFCAGFFSLPANGPVSRADTVIHEHSHASARTRDFAYGEDACKALAKNNPLLAVGNADSYAFFTQ